MTASLHRVLRIRTLLEDASRAALEKQVMQLAQIEEARRNAAGAALRSQIESFVGVLRTRGNLATSTGIDSATDAYEQRFLNEFERQVWVRRRQQLQRLAETETLRMLALRQGLLEKRKERRQVETLLQTQAARRTMEDDRREQRVLDDWFAVARRRLKRDIDKGRSSR